MRAIRTARRKEFSPVSTNSLTISLSLLLLFVAPGAGVSAQRRRSTPVTGSATSAARAEAKAARAKAREDLAKATAEYKVSLQKLLALREANVVKASAQHDKLKELFTDGIISRREIENSDAAIVEERAKVADVRRQMEAADMMLAESLVEDEVAPLPVFVPGAPADYVRKTAYIRYNGSANWSLADAARIESMFASKFNRRLPISAFGQTELHNRWGYDHRHAMDVGVHPDSREGQALTAYLQSAGIPFIAFRQAVPGSASGPHIHIGRPSHKVYR